MRTLLSTTMAAAVLLVTLPAQAGKTDSLYEIETSAPRELAVGESGHVQLKIKMKDGAHISAEAPLKATLSAANLKLEKTKLSRTDAVHQPDGPRFVVPVTGMAAGPASVEADLVFFVCTDTLCERQAKKVKVEVSVK